MYYFVAITCPIQNPPINGTFRSVPETGFGSVLTVECYEGYFVFGEDDIQCLDLNNDGNGEWNAPLPSCERKKNFLESFEKSALKLSFLNYNFNNDQLVFLQN